MDHDAHEPHKRREQSEAELPHRQTLPLDPQHYETTIARVRRMTEREKHPTWFQAAYADLAQRLVRVDERLDALEASMSLLHAKMEMLIMQRAIEDREARDD
jgi:hypothetical protein